MSNLSEFINPDNQILKHRVAQKLARSKPQMCSNTYNEPSAQDYFMAGAVLSEIAGLIAINTEMNEL
jgi:hypothetical protein